MPEEETQNKMELPSLCLVLSTLSITPDRSQFFGYDLITLRCESNSTGWMVKRIISNESPKACSREWGFVHQSTCIIQDAFTSDTGVYWCESERGECSDRVNITVTRSVVILESPLRPVMEGDDVTLRCSYKKNKLVKSSYTSADFYKDGVFIGTEITGKMTLKAVSKSAEGFYVCQHPSKGKSPESWLAVRAREKQILPSLSPPSAPPPPAVPWPRVISGILLFLLYSIILVLCVYIYRKRAEARARRSANLAVLQ